MGWRKTNKLVFSSKICTQGGPRYGDNPRSQLGVRTQRAISPMAMHIWILKSSTECLSEFCEFRELCWAALSCIDHVVVTWCNYCDTGFGVKISASCLAAGSVVAHHGGASDSQMQGLCYQDSWFQTRTERRYAGKRVKQMSSLLPC